MQENMRTFENFWKKSFGFEKKIRSDTEIGPWFRFPILKPGFGRTLFENVKIFKGLVSTQFKMIYSVSLGFKLLTYKVMNSISKCWFTFRGIWFMIGRQVVI